VESRALRMAATAVVFCALVVSGCSQPIRAPARSPNPDRGARSQAALESVASELLEAFRAGEGVDLVRESVRLVSRS
jgi:hypothetical protein